MAWQAMILAAGLGTRLRPHTSRRPKPLFPVLDRPLLLRLIDDLRRAGCNSILVNAFHLRQQIKASLAALSGVAVQLEERELGTGGGLRRACAALAPAPVLVVNGDIVHNIDYRMVYHHHLAIGNDVTLVLHDYPRFNNVLVGPGEAIAGFAPESAAGRQLAFTGLQVINPDLLLKIPPAVFYHSIDWYRQLIAAGCRVKALVVDGHYWTDMGTPADYLQLHAELLTGRAPLYRDEMAAVSGEPPVFHGTGVRLERDVQFADWAVLGSHSRLAAGVSLRRCVVWDGVTVAAGTTATDTIFS
ncbi:MAG: sugar phosphate nucleotidyltransferase [Desulfurivibrio sp.]|nr:sugar phosphate nucleotidyltransferase [Desulfurivibrio sp.]